jgi:hypothetical protein
MNDKYPMETAAQEGALQKRRLDVTLRQNIDQQIEQAEKRVADLKDIKQRLEASNLLDTRIDDLQSAMRW